MEIAFDNVNSGLRLRVRLQRIVGQEADKNTAFCEQPGRFRADLTGGGYGITKGLLRDGDNFGVCTDISASLSDRQVRRRRYSVAVENVART